MKSNDWLDRQKRDFYYKKAKNSGYVSRAAFKILEIEKKFKLISNSKKILEIGSSPGGWSQAIFEIKENSKSKISVLKLYLKAGFQLNLMET